MSTATNEDAVVQLLLQEAQRLCGIRPVLVEEAQTPDDAAWCRSDSQHFKRAWFCDETGVRFLSPDEFRAYRQQHDAATKDLFVLFSFCLSEDLTRVSLGVIAGPRMGHGGGWLLVHGDRGLELKPDPQDAGWIS